MIQKAFAILLVSFIVSACSMFKEKTIKPPPKSPYYPVTLKWANKLIELGPDRYARLLPAITDQSILVADVEGVLTAYSPETGELMWQKEYNTIFSAGPNVYGDIALLGDKNATVYAVRVADGELIWKRVVSSEILAPPQLGGGMVIVQTNDGKIFGMREDDGSIIWVYERSVPVLSLRGNSTPAIINDEEVIVGFASGKLVSLLLKDGKLMWETTVSLAKGRTELERIIDIDGPIVHDAGVIYVSAYRGRAVAIDVNGGGIIWAREMSSHLGLVLDGNLLYMTDADGRVWALDRESGATLWMQDKLTERANTRPAVQGNNIVIGDVTGELYWLAKSDGRLLGHLDYDQISEISGVTFIGDELDGEEEEDSSPTSVVFQANVTDNNILVTYQNGIIASISADGAENANGSKN